MGAPPHLRVLDRAVAAVLLQVGCVVEESAADRLADRVCMTSGWMGVGCKVGASVRGGLRGWGRGCVRAGGERPPPQGHRLPLKHGGQQGAGGLGVGRTHKWIEGNDGDPV